MFSNQRVLFKSTSKKLAKFFNSIFDSKKSKNNSTPSSSCSCVPWKIRSPPSKVIEVVPEFNFQVCEPDEFRSTQITLGSLFDVEDVLGATASGPPSLSIVLNDNDRMTTQLPSSHTITSWKKMYVRSVFKCIEEKTSPISRKNEMKDVNNVQETWRISQQLVKEEDGEDRLPRWDELLRRRRVQKDKETLLLTRMPQVSLRPHKIFNNVLKFSMTLLQSKSNGSLLYPYIDFKDCSMMKQLSTHPSVHDEKDEFMSQRAFSIRDSNIQFFSCPGGFLYS